MAASPVKSAVVAAGGRVAITTSPELRLLKPVSVDRTRLVMYSLTDRGDDPAALLARRILSLQHNDDQSAALMEEARAELSNIARDDQWSPLGDQRSAIDPLSDDALREMLLQAGKAALHAMVSDNAEHEPS